MAEGLFGVNAPRSMKHGACRDLVMVCSFVDEDGDLRIYCDTMDDQRCHVSLGLLAFATAVENKRAVADWETE